MPTLGTNQSILDIQSANYGPGTFHPEVVVTYQGQQIADLTYTVTVRGIGATCISDLREKQFNYVVDATHVIKGDAIWHLYNNLLGQQCEYSGYIEMHVQDASGNWNRRKNKDTHLCVTIDGDIRQDNYNCTTISGSSHADGCDNNTNRKSKAVGYSAVKRFHYIHVVHTASINGGVSGTFDQELSACE